jgi:hypothetical protein
MKRQKQKITSFFKKKPADTDSQLVDYIRGKSFHIVHDPRPDGSCLFSAMSHQLSDAGIANKTAFVLRQETVDYLSQKEHETLADFVPTAAGIARSDGWRQYLEHMRNDGTYGDNLSLLALSRIYNIQIFVLSTLGAVRYSCHSSAT